MLCAFVFYWTPLTSVDASIQWDAVDVHYSSQKYFADHIRDFRLPHWTPYIFSGFPFLADPQVGAWYPLNWPFFLAGITPRVGMEMDLGMVTNQEMILGRGKAAGLLQVAILAVPQPQARPWQSLPHLGH